mmetsp:Transcript_114201/g.329862  ORF Transcript_114201/g.329862 Transcript_114201/m.329862 type:complete len:249 (+) Transcript_114201:1851-2597(+)
MLQDRRQQGGRGEHPRATMPLQCQHEQLRVEHRAVGDDEGRQAREQRPHCLPDEHDVEGLTVIVRLVGQHLVLREVAEAQEEVRASDLLRPPGGAGGHHQDAKVVGRHHRQLRGRDRGRQRIPVVEHERRASRDVAELLRVPGAHDRCRSAARLHNFSDHPRGEVRLEDDEHASRPPDGEHAEQVRRVVRHEKTDDLVSPAAKELGVQLRGQELHARCQLRIGDSRLVVDDGLAVSEGSGALQHHLVD